MTRAELQDVNAQKASTNDRSDKTTDRQKKEARMATSRERLQKRQGTDVMLQGVCKKRRFGDEVIFELTNSSSGRVITKELSSLSGTQNSGCKVPEQLMQSSSRSPAGETKSNYRSSAGGTQSNCRSSAGKAQIMKKI